jgi:hypothetical protein
MMSRSISTVTFVFAVAAAFAACGSADHPADSDAGGPVTTVPVHPPMAQPAPVDPQPTTPDGLGWSDAPLISGVQYIPNRDSLELVVPPVAGAVDYRAIVLSPTIGVYTDGGRETITGTTIVCAGYLQRNTSPDLRELVDTLQVAGLSGSTRIVIEAIDAPCPFTGVIGASHVELDRTRAANPEILAEDEGFYAVFTEAEEIAAYGATIVNGQGSAAQTGRPAPLTSPRVLGRTTVIVAPTGTAAPAPVADFFDDFAIADQPKLVSAGATCYPPDCTHPFIDIFQNQKWTFEAAGMDVDQYFVDRGQLHAVVADGGADDFASTVAYPRQLAQLSDTSYLHATYEVNVITSDRRYPWLSICGADQPGQTIAADGSPRSHLNPDSGLQLGDGDNPNQSGFNCIMVFSKDGNPVFALPAGDGTESPPETDMRVLIYKTGTGLTGVNVSPDQYANGFMPHAWFRQQGAGGKITGPMLDRQNLNAPTSHFDVFVRRGRVVVYVDGAQKLCNDFDPAMVTMSEAMVGFGQVLYHTSTEHNEMTPDPNDPNKLHGRMHHVHGNLKYFDRRDWDNLGFESGVALPASGPSAFDETACYRSAAK